MEWSSVSKIKLKMCVVTPNSIDKLEMCVVTPNSIDKINAPKIAVEEFF